jgi:class 3 adenylate cyclase
MSDVAVGSVLDALDVPVLIVEGDLWVVRFANRCAHEWLGAVVGDALSVSMPELDRPRLLSKIARGREARHEQRTCCQPSFSAQFFFKEQPDGRVLIEGRSGAALEEAEAMVASYSLLVEKQKKLIEQETARVEKLLLNILPRKSVEQLRHFGRTTPERFDDVSVLFLDFVGFTALSQTLTPDELFSELNDIFSAFDDIVTFYECERIKTIGDAYLAVCGMPDVNARHAEQIVKAALAMRSFVRERNMRMTRQWSCRIGIHSGAVTAGVVGRLKYIYDIFGDGVNTASRMENHADPMHINISTSTRARLDETFVVRERGLVEVKGKGPMEMFYVDDALLEGPVLIGEDGPASRKVGIGALFNAPHED